MGAWILPLVLALAGEPPAAPAQPAAPAVRPVDVNAFTFALEPARIVLGETETVTVTVTARRADGTPLDVADPRVGVSLGTVGPATRTGPGTWTAVYTPPAPGPPQVAVLVAAIDAGPRDAVGFTTLPLWGKGETVVRTEPGSSVRVKAGEDLFGPVKADAKGVARVPLALRPGVTRGTTISLDEANNSTEATLDLRVPPFNRVALLPLDDATVSDGDGFARLVAVTVDEAGAPTLSGTLALRASTGAVEMRRALAPGLRELVLRPGKTQAEFVDVDVTLERSKDSRATARVPLVAGRAAAVRITLSRAVLPEIDDDRAVVVDFQLVDAAGRAVPPQGAGVFVDLGRLADLTRDADGTRHVTWLIPKRSGAKDAKLEVHLPDGTVLGSAVVVLTTPARKEPPPDKPRVPPRPRPGLLLGAGALLGTNYASLLSGGLELSALARIPVPDVPLYLGASAAALPAILPPDIAEHRAFPVFFELSWRPEVAPGFIDGVPIDFVLGASTGVVVSDLVARSGGPHLVEPALAGQAVIGFAFGLGPGALEAAVRCGTALYPFGGGTNDVIGLPLGASVMLTYRFGLLTP